MSRRPGLSHLALVALLLGAGPAQALEPPPAPPSQSTRSEQESLRDRIGLESAERDLESDDASVRQRALERLSGLDFPQATELLVRSLDPGGSAQTPSERLIAVRGLSRRPERDSARECLVRVLTGITVSAERRSPLQSLLRDTAALALAESGREPALLALGRALRQPGRVAEAAASALVAHPPLHLGPLLRAHGAPTLELVSVLGRLGDQRAFDALRAAVRAGPLEIRAAAALALTELGDFETVALARRWATAEPPELRLAAAEILSLSRDAGAAPLLNALLGDPKTRTRARAMLLSDPTPDMRQSLLAELGRADAADLPGLFRALGQAGGTAALGELSALSRRSDTGDAASYALALASGEAAGAALAELLADRATRTRAARAAVLRRVALGEPMAGLGRVLDQLLVSSTAADRAVGAFGLSLLDPDRIEGLLLSPHAEVIQAVARAAPFVGAAPRLAPALSRAPPGATRTQLAIVLIDPRAQEDVPTRVLLSLIDEGGPAAPLSLYALAARDPARFRARLRALGQAPDPLWRSHVALGLGESRQPGALALLEAAYRFEPDPVVRRAVIRAVARHPERARQRVLGLAARLDPDDATRNLARLALGKTLPSVFSTGQGTLWLKLERGDDHRTAAAVVSVAGGLALPVLADPEGVVALSGLPEGPVTLGLALLDREDDARPDGHQTKKSP